MLNRIRKSAWSGAVAAALVGTLGACDKFVEVTNPDQLEATAIDPDADRTTLSQSAYQSMVAAYGDWAVYSAWFSNEARVGDTFPTRNEFGRREISALTNGDNAARWTALHNALAFAENTRRSIEAAGDNIDLARAYFTAGYLMILQAELFCQPTILIGEAQPGFALETNAALDTGIVRLTRANAIAKAITGNTEATEIANASLVGIARAHLQAGRRTQASQFAAQVPAAFVYNLKHLDDSANRGRLGNDIWSFSEARISLVVGDEYRSIANCGQYLPSDTSCVKAGTGFDTYRPKATGDPRIAYTDMRRPAQDGELNFNRQAKITGWGSSDRLASGLEARYIKVEADRVPADMLAFINERRAVGKQPAMAATTDVTALMRELMEQRARDFWLELKKQGDIRRNPGLVPYVLPVGPNSYYKSGLGPVADQQCWPAPDAERRNNPNWPGYSTGD